MIIDRTDGPPLIAHDIVVEAELDGPFDSESAFPSESPTPAVARRGSGKPTTAAAAPSATT